MVSLIVRDVSVTSSGCFLLLAPTHSLGLVPVCKDHTMKGTQGSRL